MRGADGTQAACMGAVQMIERDERVRTLQRKHIADGQGEVRIITPREGLLPLVEMILQSRGIAELHELARFFHAFIPGELGLRHGPSLRLRTPAEDGTVGIPLHAGELCGHTEADACTTHFSKTHHTTATVRFVLQMGFLSADLGERLREIAVPFNGVEREVEVSVEDEHGLGFG